MIDLFHNFWFLVFISATIISVVAIIAQAWQQIRRAEHEAVLKQDMLQRELSVEAIERVIRVSGESAPAGAPSVPEGSESDEQILEKLTNCLAERDTSGEVIEQVLALYGATDRPSRRALYRAIIGLTDGCDPSDDQIMAVVRGLCRPVPTAQAERPYSVPEQARS